MKDRSLQLDNLADSKSVALVKFNRTLVPDRMNSVPSSIQLQAERLLADDHWSEQRRLTQVSGVPPDHM